MIEKKIVVSNKLGLHARPCSMLVSTASKFSSEFEIEKDGMKINGKSILGVMMLAAAIGTELTLIADGDDEDVLMEDVVALFENKFNEE